VIPEVDLGPDDDGVSVAVVCLPAVGAVWGRWGAAAGSVGALSGRKVVKARPEECVSGRASSQRHGHPRPGD